MLSAGDGGAMINDLQMQCGRQHCYVVVAFIGLHDIFILNVIDWGLSSSRSKAFTKRTLLHMYLLDDLPAQKISLFLTFSDSIVA